MKNSERSFVMDKISILRFAIDFVRDGLETESLTEAQIADYIEKAYRERQKEEREGMKCCF